MSLRRTFKKNIACILLRMSSVTNVVNIQKHSVLYTNYIVATFLIGGRDEPRPNNGSLVLYLSYKMN